MPGKKETLAAVRESFEKVKRTHGEWEVETSMDETFRFEVSSIGVQGLISAANAENLADSQEGRELVAEMADWVADVQPGPQRVL